MWRQGILGALLGAVLLGTVSVNGEYMFTMGRSMEVGKGTTACLQLIDLELDSDGGEFTVDVSVTLQLKGYYRTPTKQQTTVYVYEYQIFSTQTSLKECFKIKGPTETNYHRDTYDAVAVGTVTYTSKDGDEVIEPLFNKSSDVKAFKMSKVTLVQTDKPIYKPGQTVKFRVMTLDKDFMVDTEAYPQITIETPSGVRIKQWDNVPAPNGLVSLEMALSTDPMLGEWKIKVDIGDTNPIIQPFKVDEYVLPKFEVIVTPPKYLTPTTNVITGTVCAKYTYGKPVKGKLSMNVCYKSRYYYGEEENARPCVDILEAIDGCYNFEVEADVIGLANKTYQMWGELQLKANVTEDGTGIELSGESSGPSLSINPIQIELTDKMGGIFKPGIPYKGQVKVTEPDGEPAIGEEIMVSAFNDNVKKFEKTFLTDENGLIEFYIDELTSDIAKLQLSAVSTVYKRDIVSPRGFAFCYGFWRPWRHDIYVGDTWKTVHQWYSPSNSYIYIPDTVNTLACDKEHEIDVFYTTDTAEIHQFEVMITTGEQLVSMETIQNQYDGSLVDLNVLSIRPDQVLDVYIAPPTEPTTPPTVPTPSIDYGEPVEEEVIKPEVFTPLGTEDIRKKRNAGNVLAHFKHKIDISAEMNPNAKMLIYYTRDDGEIVAATTEFKVQNCFKHKATMSFDREKAMPGEDVNLNLQAEAASTCFVGMVDKSVSLLGGSGGQLTPDVVYDKARRYVNQHFYHPYWDEDRDYCEKQKYPFEKAEDSYFDLNPEGSDSAQAFRDMSLMIATDGEYMFRPCVPRVYYTYYQPVALARGQRPGMPGMSGAIPEIRNMESHLSSATDKSSPDPEPQVEIRSFFPETWLWDIYTIGLNPLPAKHNQTLGLCGIMVICASSADRFVPADLLSLWGSFVRFVMWTNIISCVVLRSGFGGPVALAGKKIPKTSGTRVTADDKGSSENEAKPVDVDIRSYFPETWLWDMFIVGPDGTTDVTLTVPDTITEWVGNALCNHPTEGLGVTPMIGLTAFQPFFVSLTLPYAAIRGETLPLKVTVFNYLEKCLEMQVNLAEMEGIEIKASGGSSRQFCLCGGDSETSTFFIIPTIIGEVDIEATAISLQNTGVCDNVILSEEGIGVSDGVQRQLLVEAEGVPLDMTTSEYICVEAGEEFNHVQQINFPDNMVQGSERATFAVMGDIMGPAMTFRNLLRMPYGCGEQNAASWAPNIYVTQYLESTNQLTEKLKMEAESFMFSGYQRQMRYRHHDNSYSGWGENQYNNATGSSWLTSFVVKVMAEAADYVTIDREDIKKSVSYLVSTQDPEGCFPQRGSTSSYLKGGLKNDNRAGMTTFILLALLEADVQEEVDALERGFQCLDSFIVSDVDTYTLAVMSYAYSKYTYGSDRRAHILQELMKRKQDDVDGQMYWKREDEPEPVRPRWWWYRAPGAQVEMTSYVMLSLMQDGLDYISELTMIVQWLTQQRNPWGGFSSTQDTVIAIKALAKFASLTYTGEGSSVDIMAMTPNFRASFNVTPSNSLVYQSKSFNPKDGSINSRISGAGCALIQTNVKYNIYKEEDRRPAFAVKVRTFRSSKAKRSCAHRQLQICASYQKDGGISNMAVAEVKMLTGWVPVEETLKDLLKSDEIKKYEIEKGYVQIYFDQLTKDTTCITFEVEQEIRMSPKDAKVRVYDYYETAYTVTVPYGIKTTCGTKEEIPLDNAGLDCSIMQCRVTGSPHQMVSCPTCSLKKPEEAVLKPIFCGSGVVYKTTVGRTGRYPLKIKADMRHRRKKVLNKFSFAKVHHMCTCDALFPEREEKAFIITTSDAYDSKKYEMGLGDESYVFKYSRKLEKDIRKLSRDGCDTVERKRRKALKKQRRIEALGRRQ